MFVILVAGFAIAFAAVLAELLLRPPLWLHLVLWLPLAAGLSLALLRPFKGLMLALQLHHGARETRDDDLF